MLLGIDGDIIFIAISIVPFSSFTFHSICICFVGFGACGQYCPYYKYFLWHLFNIILFLTQQKRDEEAAIKIQSGYRGYLARRRVKTIREERATNLEVFIGLRAACLWYKH